MRQRKVACGPEADEYQRDGGPTQASKILAFRGSVMGQSRLRSCVMTLPGVTERVILDRVSFLVRGKTFATESWPEAGWAVVKLSLGDQKRFSVSRAIQPEQERGEAGITLIRLQGVDDGLLTDILAAAWSYAHGESRNASMRLETAAADDHGRPPAPQH